MKHKRYLLKTCCTERGRIYEKSLGIFPFWTYTCVSGSRSEFCSRRPRRTTDEQNNASERAHWEVGFADDCLLEWLARQFSDKEFKAKCPSSIGVESKILVCDVAISRWAFQTQNSKIPRERWLRKSGYAVQAFKNFHFRPNWKEIVFPVIFWNPGNKK